MVRQQPLAHRICLLLLFQRRYPGTGGSRVTVLMGDNVLKLRLAYVRGIKRVQINLTSECYRALGNIQIFITSRFKDDLPLRASRLDLPSFTQTYRLLKTFTVMLDAAAC